MATTIKYALNNENWTKVAEGVGNVAIQLGNQGRILVHIGDSAPALGAAGVAIGNTTKELPKTFGVSNLPLTAAVYALVIDEAPMDIVVVAY